MDNIVEAAPVAVEQTTQVEQQSPVVNSEEQWLNQFSQLSAKERKLLEKEKAIKEKEAKYSKYSELESIKDPMKILESYGYTIDQISEHLLSQFKPEPSPIDLLKQEIEELKNASKREKEEAQKAREEVAVNNFKSIIKEQVEALPDDYELIRTYNAYDDVYELCKEWWEMKQERLPIEQAARMIENHYEEQIAQYTKLKKLQKLMGMQTEQPRIEQKQENSFYQPERPTSSNSFTLNNSLTSASSPKKRREEMSEQEHLDEVLKIFR